MNNLIRKTGTAIKGGPGGVGFWSYKGLLKAGRLFIERKSLGSGVANEEPLSADGFTVLGTAVAAKTLDGTDDGHTYVANNAAATVVFTLPKVATVGKGFRVRLLAGVLPGAGAGLTATPNAVDKFQGNGFNAKTAGQTLINSAATDAVGDWLDLQSDGGIIWYVIGKIGTWA